MTTKPFSTNNSSPNNSNGRQTQLIEPMLTERWPKNHKLENIQEAKSIDIYDTEIEVDT